LNKKIKCPYCTDEFYKSDLKTHIQYLHREKYEDGKIRLKYGYVFALVGFSVVIGMMIGLML